MRQCAIILRSSRSITIISCFVAWSYPARCNIPWTRRRAQSRNGAAAYSSFRYTSPRSAPPDSGEGNEGGHANERTSASRFFSRGRNRLLRRCISPSGRIAISVEKLPRPMSARTAPLRCRSWTRSARRLPLRETVRVIPLFSKARRQDARRRGPSPRPSRLSLKVRIR